MSTLTDTELTAWIVELRHKATAAHQAAAVATGDESTRTMLATAADIARRREEFVRSRALVRSTCSWCDSIGELCDECKGLPDGASR
ncbi:hypothetical protein SPF06_07125 [Sinomonas sp. JGH33]|uniref:Uncharacterized protein n=1 Tax=Sinomonas terricola TaxID=3110330 RepID=A0ABU5T498_9MICC|nr:hypothetical protein [Sinomonas sp. JGH33]MEA5454489.1 hypothetical protein [Sinomonas sp. JGH33]